MDDLPTRWEVELEFVQSLANIQYLNHLAQNKYLSNPEFLNYLEYLQYWTKPEYSKYLVYPNCLHILTLLKSEEFRKSIVNPEFMNLLMNDMVKRWQDQDQSLFENSQDSGNKTGLESSNGSNSNPDVSGIPAISAINEEISSGEGSKNGENELDVPSKATEA